MKDLDGAVVPTRVITGVIVPDGQAEHYSTGRLTRSQAAAVNAWRARLRLDKPLSGHGYQPGAAGRDSRPRASCSDAVAAAVADLLLRQPPPPLELARYAYASMTATSSRGRSDDAAQLYPPVSWYLPQWLTGPAEELRAAAWNDVLHAHDEAESEAARFHPGKTRAAAMARCSHKESILARAGLPVSRQIPRGAIARMAIDLWTSRHPDDVAADAVAYAAEVHQQPHRARRDMRTLER